MLKETLIEEEGQVVERLPDARFRVKLKESEQVVLAYTAGKMRKYCIKIDIGDRVKLEMSCYDTTGARITYRYKK